MTARTAAIGKALIDVVRRSVGVAEHVGDAVALCRLRNWVALMTAIDAEARGTCIRQHVRPSDAVVDPASIRTSSTPTATAAVDERDSTRYTFEVDWSLPEAWRIPPAVIAHTGWLWPDVTLAEAIRTTLELGPTLVAITLGAEGAIDSTRTASTAVPAPSASVVDTIEAGDTSMAGIKSAVARRVDGGTTIAQIRSGDAFDAHLSRSTSSPPPARRSRLGGLAPNHHGAPSSGCLPRLREKRASVDTRTVIAPAAAQSPRGSRELKQGTRK